MSDSRAATRRHVARHRRARPAVPRTVPVTFERPGARVVGDRHLARCASRRRRRAAPSPAASRSGGRAMPSAEQRLAAGGAHRAEVAQRRRRVRRRSSSASTRLAARACSGQAPRATGGARRARGRRSPASTGVGDARQLARVERGVAVHEADDVGARRASGPAKQAAPKPRRGSRDDARAERARRARPSRRSSRCRRRSARSPAGIRSSTHGSAVALVEDGQDRRRARRGTVALQAA